MRVPERVRQIGCAAGQPAYVYDLPTFRRTLAAVERIPWANKRIFFATMANDHPALLDAVRERGHGLFVNSLRHLQLALQLGVAPERIVYAASNMSDDDMRACCAGEVNVVLDSLGEIARFGRLARRGTAIGVRVNVGSALDGVLKHDPAYRFGVLPDELPAAVTRAAAAGIRVTGVHSYFGTDLMEPSTLIAGLERLTRVAEALPDLEYVDGGGGFGVSDEFGSAAFDLDAYGVGAALAMAALEQRLGRKVALYVEPGRYLAATCGWFFTKVVNLKPRADRLFAGTNASVAQFPRPLLYPEKARHPWQIVGREIAAPHQHPVWICGNSTYSRDFLARAAVAPAPEVGETLVFYNAGAYCRSMLTEFLGKERPLECVLEDERSGIADVDERPAAATER